MPTGLEERIRKLCANAVAAKHSEELITILSELRAALQEQDTLAKGLIAERTRMAQSERFLSREWIASPGVGQKRTRFTSVGGLPES